MKKLLALVLCLVMVLSLTAVAFADDAAEGGADAGDAAAEESKIDTTTEAGDHGQVPTDATIEGAIDFIYEWYDAVVEYMWNAYQNVSPAFDGKDFDTFYQEAYEDVAVQIVINVLDAFIEWYESFSAMVN